MRIEHLSNFAKKLGLASVKPSRELSPSLTIELHYLPVVIQVHALWKKTIETKIFILRLRVFSRSKKLGLRKVRENRC